MKAKSSILIGVLILFVIVISILLLFQLYSWKEVTIKLDSNYFDFISQSQIKEKGHLISLPEYNSDVSIGFKNLDNSKTLYVFSSPIRFLDSNNQHSFIDTRIINTPDGELRDNDYIYTVSQNDVKPYFPKKLSANKGILLTKDFEINMKPETKRSSCVEYINQNNFINKIIPMARYKKIFQKEDILSCYPTALGFNLEYSCKIESEYIMKFALNINEEDILIRKEKGGYLILFRNIVDDKGNTKESILSVIQPPIIKIDNDIIYGNNVNFERASTGKYLISFSINNFEDFIGKECNSFVSMEMRKEKQPDNILYSKHPYLTNAYLSNYAVLGKSKDYGIGEALIRYKFVKYFNLKENQIISAKYYTYCLTKNNFNYEIMPMLEEWCSITGNWSKNYKMGSAFFNTMSSENIMALDISQEVKKWCTDDGQMEHNGIKLKQKVAKEGGYDVFLTNDNTLYQNVTEVVLE